MPDPLSMITDELQDAAAVWLSRRDRGLSATEQDDYLEWLYADPRHGRAIVHLERTWTSLNRLAEWRPAHSATPNPDLLAPRWSARLFGRMTVVTSLAAVVALSLYLALPHAGRVEAPRREAIIHPGAERLVLDDGSLVDLNTGAKIEVDFTPAERRVRLVRGEALFAVAKNPHRPFIVSAGKFAVHAVGTAFSVALGRQEVSVLVTEGKVRLDETRSAAPGQAVAPVELSPVVAGQQAVVGLAGAGTVKPEVRDVTPAEMERALAWQTMRLEFVDMPLRDVATTFNRYNRCKLVVANQETAAVLVGGSFRADNADAFVRLLGSSFGITAVRRGDEYLLQKAR